ncbi:MAG: tetratricopeptide repeat protein [Deltaproteobacteria bacterium]
MRALAFNVRRSTFDIRRSTFHPGVIRVASVLILAACCAALAGCKSPLDKGVDIKDVYGPTGRHAKNVVEQAQREAEGNTAVGVDEFNAARKLYDEQKYAEARKAFQKIVKKYGKKSEPIEEDAMFYRAECDFQLGHYPAAQDGYDELANKYPSTKYLDQSMRRLFAIARYWLNMPKPASEIELASFTDEAGEERLKTVPEATIPWQFPLKPNLTDKTRPMFDTTGRALQALKSVSSKDPTGPLADDALMMLATYHLRRKDYREADVYFKTIREHHPNSEFVPASYILGAHSSLQSYQGSRYDGKQLEEAKKQTLAAVHDLPDSPQRAKLEHDLKKIDAEAAVRAWVRVEYYLKRGEKNAAAFYCETIMEKYPGSPEAARAREALLKLGPQHAAGVLRTPLFRTELDAPAESETPYDESQEPGRLRLSDGDAKPISESK